MAFPLEKFQEKDYTLATLKNSILQLYLKYTNGNKVDAEGMLKTNIDCVT